MYRISAMQDWWSWLLHRPDHGPAEWCASSTSSHHQVLAGTSASMAPDFESANSLRQYQVFKQLLAKQGKKKEKDAA